MHILLLEDDIDLGQAVADHLEDQGHQVQWMKLCIQAQRALSTSSSEIEVMVFALGIEDGDPLELICHRRKLGDTRPALVLTRQEQQVNDRMRCLQMGADDFLHKPLDLIDLTMRLNAIGSRRHPASASSDLVFNDVLVNLERKIAKRGVQPIRLTALEWSVLTCLAQRDGHIWSRSALEEQLYRNAHSEPVSNSVEVIISRLRRKLGSNCISTHRGIGYRLEKPKAVAR